MKFSLIVPTFGRPDEVTEFLQSVALQTFRDFEVIVADGTPGNALFPAIEAIKEKINFPFRFLQEDKLPVSDARNRGAEIAVGEYLIFLDSDCLLPNDYLDLLSVGIEKGKFDFFGGPDKEHPDFTNLQKAISYSMTSLLTTGGIRGRKKHIGIFQPRGFNMGMKRTVFEALGGYDTAIKCAEDIDFSLRAIKAGYHVGLIETAHVFHKRRTSIKKFYKQVFRFGAARINIQRLHPGELKITHLFPLGISVFLIASVPVLFSPVGPGWAMPLLSLAYIFAVFVGSSLQNKSIPVGALSVLTTIAMFFGYASGFVTNAWTVYVLGRKGGMAL